MFLANFWKNKKENLRFYGEALYELITAKVAGVSKRGDLGQIIFHFKRGLRQNIIFFFHFFRLRKCVRNIDHYFMVRHFFPSPDPNSRKL